MNYWKALFSPFKPFKLQFYCGKKAIGTPYFFPRKWIKDPNKPGYKTFIPKKIGFDFVSLGWKTKWTDSDYRFEWPPIMSFVFFKWQVAVIVTAPEQDHYWEAWLYYENNTDKTKSKQERIEQCKKEYPLGWSLYGNNGDIEKVDYYDHILRRKYLKK